MSLTDKSALVTGGANGIGKATVRALLSKGCKVNIVDKVADDLKETLRQFQGVFGHENVTSTTADVTSDRELRAAFDHSVSLFGGLDIVINNAGVALEGHWERMVPVNFGGVVRGTEIAIEYMSRGRGGIIVNIGSGLGTEEFLANEPLSILPVYSATKAGVLAYSRCMAASKETRERRIQVCCFCPRLTPTNMTTHAKAGSTRDDEMFRKMVATYRSDSPDAVAEKIVSLVERDDVNGSIAVLRNEGDMLLY